MHLLPTVGKVVAGVPRRLQCIGIPLLPVVLEVVGVLHHPVEMKCALQVMVVAGEETNRLPHQRAAIPRKVIMVGMDKGMQEETTGRKVGMVVVAMEMLATVTIVGATEETVEATETMVVGATETMVVGTTETMAVAATEIMAVVVTVVATGMAAMEVEAMEVEAMEAVTVEIECLVLAVNFRLLSGKVKS